MDKKLFNQLVKWFIESDYEQRKEIRYYVFSLSNLSPKAKEEIWNKMMSKALKSKGFLNVRSINKRD